MRESHQVMIAVAPNGARKTQRDHTQLPITSQSLAATAAGCREAGACMIHLHVRDDSQSHSLDSDRYKAAIKAIRKEVGSELIIQITTEAVGIYQPAQQMQAVKEVRPEAVSLAIRELCPIGSDAGREKEAANFFAWLYREHVSPQYILYSIEDIQHFNSLQNRGLIPEQEATILLVLGRYTEDQQSDAKQLQPLLAQVDPHNNWWLCAFGATEAACMSLAMQQGGHCRVGFENNLLLPDGETAANNEALVELTVNNAKDAGLELASADEARELMGFR